MFSAGSLNGMAAVTNTLLWQKLREWGTNCYRQTDCCGTFEHAAGVTVGGVKPIHNRIQNFATATQAAVRAIELGLQADYGDGASNPTWDLTANLTAAAHSDPVFATAITAAVERAFLTRMRLGEFDSEARNPFLAPDVRDLDSEANRASARRAAAGSIVMLRNEGSLLPLRQNRTRTIAIIGPFATCHKHWCAEQDNCGHSDLQCEYLHSYTGHPSRISTILGAVSEEAQTAGMAVTYALGANVSGPTHAAELARAVKLAGEADVTVLALGLGDLVEGEGTDRERDQGLPDHRSNALGFPDAQQQLLEAVRKAQLERAEQGLSATAPKLVLTITSAGGVDVDPTLSDAILQLWYGGEETGHGLCDVLFGRVSPSGRLPITIHPEHYLAGIGPVNDLNMRFESGQGRTYRYLRSQATDARFSFGFGLSYSSFAYSAAERGTADAVLVGGDRGAALKIIAVKVQNVGSVDAKEIMELYVTAPEVAGTVLPRYELQGFKAVFLKVGEAQTIEFQLTKKQLMTVMVDGTRVLTKGKYVVSVAGHLPDDPRGVGNVVTQAFRLKADDGEAHGLADSTEQIYHVRIEATKRVTTMAGRL